MPRLTVLVFIFFAARTSAADPLPHVQNLRPMQPWIAAAIEHGRRASPTMAQLVDEVAALPIIVHVEEADGPRQGWDGRIRFVGASGPWRFLRIAVRRHERATVAAIVAHELQHALEVHAADVQSTAEFEAFYRRSGVRSPSGAERYDTPGAVAVGERTLRELAAAALCTAAGRPHHAAARWREDMRRHPATAKLLGGCAAVAVP